MTRIGDKNKLENERFAPCAAGGLLIRNSPGILALAMAQKLLPIPFGALKLSGVFRLMPVKKFNLTRRGIFRGKIPWRKNQNQK